MNKKIIVGLLAGAAVGVLAGILLAPDSGKETRKKLSKKGKDITDTVHIKANELKEMMKEKYEAAKEAAESLKTKTNKPDGTFKNFS